MLYGLAMDEKVTKPTIETVLERMGGMEERLNQRIGMSEERVNQRMDAMEGRVSQRMDAMEERLSQRMDGLEVGVDRMRSVVFELRADFRELTVKLKEHLPELR